MIHNRNTVRLTILHRPNGNWSDEIDKILSGLTPVLHTHHKYPEYLILSGHFTKEKTLEVLAGGTDYTVKQITGLNNPELPFHPSF